MKLHLIEQLRCPARRGAAPCGGRIELDHAAVQPSLTGDEVRDGLLRCRACGCIYPVLGGIAALREDALGWLRSNHTAIAAGLLDTNGLSPALGRWLDDQGWRHGNQPAVNYYESARWVEIFLATHYDRVPAGADDPSPLARLIAEAPSVFDVVSQMIARHPPRALRRALDVGTNVGGMASRLAVSVPQVWGIDVAFNPLLAARRIHHGVPAPLPHYRRTIDGHHYDRRAIEPQAPNAEFVLASALDLPFGETFDLITALNVVDSAPDPRELIAALVAALEPGGCLVITSPYSWTSDDTLFENWIGATQAQPSDRAVIDLLEHSHMNVLAEQDDVPWVLREHRRWYRVFLTHCVLAHKPAVA